MSKFRDKLQTFIFGLSVGLLIACLFFIFKLDDYFRKIDFSVMSQKKNISEEIVKPKEEEEKQEKTAAKKNESSPVKKTNTFSASNYSSDSTYTESENYRVLKEEMVSVKNVYVKILTPKEKISPTDSLIASLAGVTTTDETDFFMIEFWKTPLNSKGYKMTRNRLLIYGYNENPDVAVIKFNDNYYLRNNGLIYKLYYSADFTPLERVDDSVVAGKFN